MLFIAVDLKDTERNPIPSVWPQNTTRFLFYTRFSWIVSAAEVACIPLAAKYKRSVSVALRAS